MRIGQYTASKLPVEAGGSAFSVGGERRSPVNVPRSGEFIGGSLRRAGDVLEEIADRMRDARQAQELSQVQVNNRRFFADLDNKMRDPAFLKSTASEDFEDFFNEKAGEAWTDISEGIREDRVKHAARMDFENVKTGFLVRVRDRSRQVQISTGRASTDKQLRDLTEIMLSGDAQGDSKAVSDALITAQGIVSGKVRAGLFTAEEGDTMMEQFRKNTTGTIWARRIQQDPAGAFQELSKGDKIPNMIESERVALTEYARNAYESMLRTRIYANNLQNAQTQKALKVQQEQTAAKYWVEIQNNRPISQGALDKDVTLGRLELNEYRALSAAARNPEGVLQDDPGTILAVERALDFQEYGEARSIIYGGIEDGILTNATGTKYLSTIRSGVKGEVNADRTASEKLLRTTFRQDGLLPDMTLNSRYRDAVLGMIAYERQGKNPLRFAIDTYRKEANSIGGNLPMDWPGGTVTEQSINAYQDNLTARLQSGEINKTEYRARYNIAQNALETLRRNEAMNQQIGQLEGLLK